MTARPNTAAPARTGIEGRSRCGQIHGRWRLELSVGVFVLEKPGDYVVWGPGVDHSWRAEEDSVVMTVRWPSGEMFSR